MSARSSLLLVIVGGLLTVIPALAVPARAAPLDKREIQARADFAAGRYQQAVEKFAELYAQTADPVFLRNIARCYQKMKRPQEAIDRFNDYLHKATDLSPVERAEIDGYIKEMEALRATQEPPVAATRPAAPSPAPPAPAGAPERTPDPKRELEPTKTARPSPAEAPPAAAVSTGPPGSGTNAHASRVAGIATAAAGAALAGVGLAFGIAARSAGERVSNTYDSSTAADGPLYEKLQWIGYGVGAAAMVTGVLLYVHGTEEKAGDLHARAAFDGRGGALLLEGRF
jgi:tetratricopeptide (TPR) repeat protein